MCNFLSVNSNGQGKIYYFDWKIRKKILAKKLTFEHDSHTSIATHFKLDEDKCNKYEYNPLTKKFVINKITVKDDSESVERQVRKLDFKKIVPKLIIMPIISPFKVKPPKKITKEHIKLLKEWASVRNSVRDSVRNSVWNSVRDSVWDSVRNSVWGYIGSFFILKRSEWKYTKKIKTKGYPFQSAVDLWNMGLVPSFDGKVWRLHGHKDARVLFEITKEELKKR